VLDSESTTHRKLRATVLDEVFPVLQHTFPSWAEGGCRVDIALHNPEGCACIRDGDDSPDWVLNEIEPFFGFPRLSTMNGAHDVETLNRLGEVLRDQISAKLVLQAGRGRGQGGHN
jgi:hypothetical protein